MLTTRWEPWSELNLLSREMDRLFHRGGNENASLSGIGNFPALNIWEDDQNLYAEAELPGFSVDDLEIYVTGNQLTLKGQRRPPELETAMWHRRERGYGTFSRVVELPGDIDGDSVAAEFKLGVLRITLPKSEKLKPRRIEVDAN